VEHTVQAQDADVAEQLRVITGGDMPTVVIDATGNQTAINNGINYLAHGGRYVLIGLQKGNLIFSHPEFHKREATLLSSRNATRKDFEQVIAAIKGGRVNPASFINNVVPFGAVKDQFPSWLYGANGIIKTMIENE
jgi:threonine dehydrogenase-like Zn-dependent dehydrogenase